MTISAWWLLLAAVPVLMLGEAIVSHVTLLRRFSIPASIVGGLLVAVVVLAMNLAGHALTLNTNVTQKAWMWLTTTEAALPGRGKMLVTEPLVVAFFTCIGLNASWALAKKGGAALLFFLVISSLLTLAQDGLGVVLCKAMGLPPLMGVLTGGVALMGGPGTTIGMAPAFTSPAFPQALEVGIAAATFGMVAASLIGGPAGAALIRWRKLTPTATDSTAVAPTRTPSVRAMGFVGKVWALRKHGRSLAVHGAVLLVCVHVGAWVSDGLIRMKIEPFPVYMGALLVGIALRNSVDAAGGKWLRTDVIDALASVLLGVFIVITMMAMNLARLNEVAGPLTLLLAAQTVMTVAFAMSVTFWLMGRDYDAAVLTAGQIGFALGVTPNAVATMDATTREYGPSPKAFLIVTIVGGFLIDVTNSATTQLFLRFLK